MKPDKKRLRFHIDRAGDMTLVMQIGLTMAGCIIFCFFIGRSIDALLGIKGAFTVISIILGVAGGANVVYRQIMDVTDLSDGDSASVNDNNASESFNKDGNNPGN